MRTFQILRCPVQLRPELFVCVTPSSRLTLRVCLVSSYLHWYDFWWPDNAALVAKSQGGKCRGPWRPDPRIVNIYTDVGCVEDVVWWLGSFGAWLTSYLLYSIYNSPVRLLNSQNCSIRAFGKIRREVGLVQQHLPAIVLRIYKLLEHSNYVS